MMTEKDLKPAAAGQVEQPVRPDVPEALFGNMPRGAVYTQAMGTVGAAMYTYTADQMRAYAAQEVEADRKRIKARLMAMNEAAAGRHNYYDHAAWVLFGGA